MNKTSIGITFPEITIYAFNCDFADNIYERYLKAKQFLNEELENNFPLRFLSKAGWTGNLNEVFFPGGDSSIPRYAIIDDKHHIRKVLGHLGYYDDPVKNLWNQGIKPIYEDFIVKELEKSSKEK
jgi:hypothetical protein